MAIFFKSRLVSYFLKKFLKVTCFVKSALNSTGSFQGLPQGLQFKIPYLGFVVMGFYLGSPLRSSMPSSSLGCSVIGSTYYFLR